MKKAQKADIKTLRAALKRFAWFAGWFKIGPSLSKEDVDLAAQAEEALDRMEAFVEHSIPARQEGLF